MSGFISEIFTIFGLRWIAVASSVRLASLPLSWDMPMIDETDEHGTLARAALALSTVRLLRKTGRTAIAGGGSVVVFPGLPSKETAKRTNVRDFGHKQ
jgi:hypothetical protein